MDIFAIDKPESAEGLVGGIPATEALLRQDMRGYAMAVRKLAYSTPNGVGERALLLLSAQMTTCADQRSAS